MWRDEVRPPDDTFVCGGADRRAEDADEKRIHYVELLPLDHLPTVRVGGYDYFA